MLGSVTSGCKPRTLWKAEFSFILEPEARHIGFRQKDNMKLECGDSQLLEY